MTEEKAITVENDGSGMLENKQVYDSSGFKKKAFQSDEGYQLVALGKEKYLVMAIACAISIRECDRKREIQLVTDRPEYFCNFNDIFDFITPFKHGKEWIGPGAKLKCHEYRIFKRSMFVDCDCIMFRDVEKYWDEFRGLDFVICGHKKRSGSWYRREISEICKEFGVSYVVQNNSGIIYFSDGCEKVFESANGLYESKGNFLNHNHRGYGISDEPYFAIAMGMLGKEPRLPLEKDGSGLMISTIGGREFTFDVMDGSSSFFKGENFVKPRIVHFVGAEPKEHYLRLVNLMLTSRGYNIPLDELFA